MPRTLIYLLAFACAQISLAAETTTNTTLVDQAMSLQLYKHPTWLKLLHISGGHQTSDIHSANFFLSGNNKSNAKEELKATIEAITAAIPEKANDHAICKFRGRYVWLRNLLDFDSHKIVKPVCSDYNEWSYNDDIDSLSVVFATGFLDNPASYYGHTLIKVNTTDNDISDLEDTSINFGANIPLGEGSIRYIVKGLVGGYDASFTHSQYFYHSHNYGEAELRDLWEYKLDLSPYEIDLLLGHLWELLGQQYTYYFLNRNCSHRMAEVFALLDIDVIPNTKIWSMPQRFLQKIAAVKRQKKPLVSEVIRHPSRQSKLYNRYSKLSHTQKKNVQSLINDNSLANEKRFLSLPVKEKHVIIDTLLDYYQYLRDPEAGDSDASNKAYKTFLAMRYALPPGVSDNTFPNIESPDQGRKLSYSSLSTFDKGNNINGVKLRIRPALYDPLDASFGHGVGAALSMGDIELQLTDNKLSISQLDIVKVESIKKYSTGLPGDKSKYWSLHFGWRPESLACDSCAKANAEINTGRSRTFLSEKWLIAPFIGLGLNQDTTVNDTVYGQFGALSTLQLSSSSNVLIRAAYVDQLVDSDSVDRIRIKAEYRYTWQKNRDIRLSYKKNIAEELSLSAGWYW